MQATTAPDFRVTRTDVPRLAAEPGVTLRLLVLADDGGHCAAVDLDTGVLVRAWSPRASERRLRPYDVVEVTLAPDPEAVPDPSEPEALVLDDAPEPVGRLAGRRVERLLRPLLHPKHAPLLSTHGPAVPFWERSADHPSIALVEPDGEIVLRREPGYLACRFEWQGKQRELPCLDRRVAADMDLDGRRHRVVERRTRLLVALTPPIDGHCHKVVEAVLPRP
ncbi:MAG TPA: hypothetical protein VKV25_07110 [Acidimicrobiales bacterium]|nr:hypothetical protein [Acidimicrobiales bacterium]